MEARDEAKNRRVRSIPIQPNVFATDTETRETREGSALDIPRNPISPVPKIHETSGG
jgi:hypothetical protein